MQDNNAGVKSRTLHMIGNAHLDVVWLWQWQEGLHEVKATFRAVLDLMEESDDFLFTASSAAMYEWVERNDPRMFAEIERRVAEGRWELVGGWWLQPDCNIPGGESYVRQGLYGQRYFKEKFGVTATVGYNVDSFGHHAMLPQILRKSGLTSYVFMRPQPHEQRLPGRLFWWESDDGSRVLACRIPYEYCTWGRELDTHVRKCASELRAPFDELLCFYGVGNHGGGPTRENLVSIRALAADPALPALLFSTPGRFFARVRDQDLPIPVVHDEFQHHASGCYAAHSGVKRWNRRAEHALITAEKLSTLAARLVGQPYPTDLERAWKNVLFNQFHDIIAGTSIEPAYEDARDLYGEALAIASRALNDATQAISWRIGIERDEARIPIVVFNPHVWPAAVPVELEFGRLPLDPVLVDDEGTAVPLQRVRSLATVSGGRNRILFVAHLPALGYRVYRIDAPPPAGSTTQITSATPAVSTAGPAAAHDEEADYVLENDQLLVEIDPATGCIARLHDKRLSFDVLRGQGARPVVIDDPSDTWGHNVASFDKVDGMFSVQSVRRIEHGPVRSVIRVESVYGASSLTQDIALYREFDRVDVRVTVDWREQFKLLKLRFPLNLSHAMVATYEIPYGHIERPTNGEEEPGQGWVDLTGVARGVGALYGVSILNDGKYSFDVRGDTLGLTVLRSPIYAHHVPYAPRQDERYAFIDQGLQSFAYSLLPHAGTWRGAETARRAAELNAPPVAITETCHQGPLPACCSAIHVDKRNVVVSVVKRAEDNGDTIVRCHETDGAATAATIRFPAWDRAIEARFAPCEIKTFRLPTDPTLPIVETNLIEWME